MAAGLPIDPANAALESAPRRAPSLSALLDALFEPERLRRIGLMAAIAMAVTLAAHLFAQTRAGWTDGDGHPLGDDFLNFWSAPHLALLGRVGDVYDFQRFHEFELGAIGHAIDPYHYSYPPLLILLTLPLGALPFWPAFLAWPLAGWAAFAALVRRLMGAGWLVYALALPAVLISVWSGQNGLYTAAILGWGLTLLDRRPGLAGALLALMFYKPQLAALIPLALLAGGRWRALAGFIACGAALAAATTLLFGPDIWFAYARHVAVLRTLILENGEGVWRRMISVFVFLRHSGLSVPLAYAGQGAATLIAAAAVVWAWRSRAGAGVKNTILVLGALAASPYVSDYDLAVSAFAPLWLASEAPAQGRDRARLAAIALTAAPLLSAPLSFVFGTAVGGWLLAPAFVLALGEVRRSTGASPKPTAG